MNIVLLGPPGAGKGTQAKNISRRYCIPHISIGEIFREYIKEDTLLGIEAKKYIEKGELVPDDITEDIIEQRIKMRDCMKGFLLDGFPRTISQAEALARILKRSGVSLNYVLNIDITKKSIIDRLTKRRVCASCGLSYHLIFNPPAKEDTCNVCGGSLIQRDDDKLEAIVSRIEVYYNQTAPLIDYYSRLELLYSVDGEQDIGEVFEDLCDILGSVKNDCD